MVRAGEDLQAAIDRAEPGEVLLLEAGATFTGNFVLRNKPGSAYITIRSATPSIFLPGINQRVHPADAPLLAKLQSPNEQPVIRTEPNAHHWRLLFLEFGPNATPGNDIVRFGDGSSLQRTTNGLPHHLEIDRCYLHGDANVGQKRVDRTGLAGEIDHRATIEQFEGADQL